MLVAITALILNHRGFTFFGARLASIEGRFASLDARMMSFENRVDGRLNSIQADMKDLNKRMTALAIDVALVKDKIGL